MFVGDGTYFIVSYYKAERWCIDLPSEIAGQASGNVQKFNPNASKYQKWEFVQDRSDASAIADKAFNIKWAYGDKYLVIGADSPFHEMKPLTFSQGAPGRKGSWMIQETGIPEVYVIKCRESGYIIDYWSDEDDPRGRIAYGDFVAGATQHMWILQQTQK